MPNRSYQYPDVNMLLACEAICSSLQKNIGDLSVICPQWTNEYVDRLHERIDHCIDHHLSIDPNRKLRHVSARFMIIHEPALRDIYYLKKQLENNFKKNKNLLKDILSSLGMDSHLDDIIDKSPHTLIDLLSKFKSGLSDQIRQIIVKAGTSPLLLERIIDYSDYLNIDASLFKIEEHTNKSLSDEAVEALNTIYHEVMIICKEAVCYYHFDTLKKEQFMFHKIAGKQNFHRHLSPELN